MGKGLNLFLYKLLRITSSIMAKTHFRQKWTKTVLVLSPQNSTKHFGFWQSSQNARAQKLDC